MKRFAVVLTSSEERALAPLVEWTRRRSADAWLCGAWLRRRLCGGEGGTVEALLFRDDFDVWVSHCGGLRTLRRRDVSLAEAVTGTTKLRVRAFDKLIEDCFCRDFTVNALFFCLRTRRLRDFCGGLADLRARLLRPVVNAETSFEGAAERLVAAAEAIADGFALCPRLADALAARGDAEWRAAFPRTAAVERAWRKLLGGQSHRALAAFAQPPLRRMAFWGEGRRAWLAAVAAVREFEVASDGRAPTAAQLVEAKKAIIAATFDRFGRGAELDNSLRPKSAEFAERFPRTKNLARRSPISVIEID